MCKRRAEANNQINDWVKSSVICNMSRLFYEIFGHNSNYETKIIFTANANYMKHVKIIKLTMTSCLKHPAQFSTISFYGFVSIHPYIRSFISSASYQNTTSTVINSLLLSSWKRRELPVTFVVVSALSRGMTWAFLGE